MTELVSIIVPVYNTEEYLSKCIESILRQKYRGFELLLINDGSRDGSGRICSYYAQKDSRVRVLHKQNGGVSSARNLGLDNAVGGWVMFVDSDDYIHEDMLSEFYKALQTQKDSDILVVDSYYKVVEYKITVVKDSVIKGQISSNEYVRKLLSYEKGAPIVWNKLFKRKTIGDVRFDTNIKIGEDILFQMAVLLSKKEATVVALNTETPLYYYHIRGNSAMATTKAVDFDNLSFKAESILEHNKVTNEYKAYLTLFLFANICSKVFYWNRGLSVSEYHDYYEIIKTALGVSQIFPSKYKIAAVLYYRSRTLGNMFILCTRFLRQIRLV